MISLKHVQKLTKRKEKHMSITQKTVALAAVIAGDKIITQEPSLAHLKQDLNFHFGILSDLFALALNNPRWAKQFRDNLEQLQKEAK